jgi:hypothetical protein
MLNHIRSCYVLSGCLNISCQVRIGHGNGGYVRSCQVRGGSVRLDQVKPCKVRLLCQVISGYVRLGKVSSG